MRGVVTDATKPAESFDRSLPLDPYLVHSMYEKGRTLEALGQRREATASFRDFLECAPPEVQGSERFSSLMAHARRCVAQEATELEAFCRDRVAVEPPTVRARENLATLLGKHPAYRQQPTYLDVTRLSAIPFFDRSDVPRLKWLEDATAASLEEFGSILAEVRQDGSHTKVSFEPYIRIPDNKPKDQWALLNHSSQWNAFHLMRHGKERNGSRKHFPRVWQCLEKLPLFRVRGKGPNIFVSTLAPSTRIPPHYGVSNARAVVHLPLVVPPGCGFRVDAETRRWKPGEAWCFDDTIEHEAWNERDETRVILILDVWNPLLTQDERDYFGALLAATAECGVVSGQ